MELWAEEPLARARREWRSSFPMRTAVRWPVAGTASALLPHMGLLEVFTARDRLPRSACHHQTAPSRSPLANPFRADRYLQGTLKGAKRLRLRGCELRSICSLLHSCTTHLRRVPPSDTQDQIRGWPSPRISAAFLRQVHSCACPRAPVKTSESRLSRPLGPRRWRGHSLPAIPAIRSDREYVSSVM